MTCVVRFQGCAARLTRSTTRERRECSTGLDVPESRLCSHEQTHLANVADKARKAYSAQASAHVVAWWGDGPPPRMPEPLTRAAFTELVRSREASKAALAAYRDALDER